MTETLLEDLQERRLIQQVSNPELLAQHLAAGACTLYCGFDPTADSLHLGHLVPLLVLKRFQLAGHRSIALVGGATGLIGDPSGKNKERALHHRSTTQAWTEKIQTQIGACLNLHEGTQAALVVNNLEWMNSLCLLDFLRDTGKHFAVNAMIQKESVQSRIEREGAGISFTEFSYMLLQSLDYVELANRYGCSLQIGGSDQWGNITAGMELVRKVAGKKVYGLTLPLITKANGEKLGKSDGGETLWLDAQRTSPYAFYQFWINTADKDLGLMLGYFTLLNKAERQGLLSEHEQAPAERQGQRQLAQEITALVHGEHGLKSAQRITEALFKGTPAALRQEDLAQLAQDGLPCLQLDSVEMNLRSALVQMGLVRNTTAVKDAMAKGAIQVNGRAVHEFNLRFSALAPMWDRYFLIRFGKRKWGIALTR